MKVNQQKKYLKIIGEFKMKNGQLMMPLSEQSEKQKLGFAV